MSLLILLSGLVGVALGPSLHHLAVRSGRHQAFDRLVPACETCGASRPLRRWHLGACVECGAAPRRREPVVTLAAGGVAAGAAAVAPEPWLVPAWVAFALVTLVLMVTDLDTKLLPNRVLYPGGALAAGLLAAGAVGSGRAADLLWAAVGGAGYFGVLLAVALVARGGFGFGDVKLAALLGFFCAFEGIRTLLLAVFLTGVLGGLPAIVLLVTRRAGRGDELPYGPAMILGAWIALAASEPILRWVG